MSEDGELQELPQGSNKASAPSLFYDPSFEWPGESSNVDPYELLSFEAPVASMRAARSSQPCFRLVVGRSSILPAIHKIAMLDSYREVQFGRDIATSGSTTPRVRLKEMEVSKLHATAYWDGAKKEWSIVDMGSKHGTFLRVAKHLSGAPARLSPPRVASMPRKLRHMDEIAIGSTVFTVHIHSNQLPCDDCHIVDKQEIPLFPSQKKDSLKRTRDATGFDFDDQPPGYTPGSGRDAKKALTMLKQSLLTRHSASNVVSRLDTPLIETSYVDRAARRRSVAPASYSDAPGVAIPSVHSESSLSRPLETVPELPVSSQPPTLLTASNVGHRLLMKQGWAPGTALGVGDTDDERRALVEPLDISGNNHRAGLGVKKETTVGTNWKERERQKRFERYV